MVTTWFRRRAAQAVAVILLAALLTVAPSAATAADAGELWVETYVLPLGSAMPSLEELQNGDGAAAVAGRRCGAAGAAGAGDGRSCRFLRFAVDTSVRLAFGLAGRAGGGICGCGAPGNCSGSGEEDDLG